MGPKSGVGVFVVELPADDVGVVAEVEGHLLGDVVGELAVFGIGEGELLAIAVLGALAVLIDAQGLGIFGGEPRGRRGGGRAEDDADVMFGGEGDGAVEPAEVVVALGRFHGAPGKFADAHDVDVGGFHEREVFVPLRLGPLLGIPGGAEEQRRLIGVVGGLGVNLRHGRDEEGSENACSEAARDAHVRFPSNWANRLIRRSAETRAEGGPTQQSSWGKEETQAVVFRGEGGDDQLGCEAGGVGMRQVRAERMTSAIQRRSAPRRWVICIQVGARRANIGDAEQELKHEEKQNADGEGTIGGVAQTASDEPDDEDAGDEADGRMKPANLKEPGVAGGEVLRDGGEEIVRGVESVAESGEGAGDANDESGDEAGKGETRCAEGEGAAHGCRCGERGNAR